MRTLLDINEKNFVVDVNMFHADIHHKSLDLVKDYDKGNDFLSEAEWLSALVANITFEKDLPADTVQNASRLMGFSLGDRHFNFMSDMALNIVPGGNKQYIFILKKITLKDITEKS